MIDDLVDDLKSDEGWCPFVYDDSLGFKTLGYGFLIDQRRGGEIPKPIAEAWLTYAATQRWNQFVSKFPWLSDQHEDVQRALGNMVYQMGVGGVSNFKKMLGALQSADRELAATEALDSRWAIQTPKRAKRVTDLMRGDT